MVWLIYLLDCWQSLPRSVPPIVNLLSSRFLQYEASLWRMSMISIVLLGVNIKSVIFHMANSIVVLEFWNLNQIWRWTFIKKSSSLKLDWLGVIRNVRGHFLVISKTGFVFVVNDLFPRSDNGLRKIKLNMCIIFIWTFFWSVLTDLIECTVLMWIILKFKRSIVLNNDKVRISFLLL